LKISYYVFSLHLKTFKGTRQKFSVDFSNWFFTNHFFSISFAGISPFVLRVSLIAIWWNWLLKLQDFYWILKRKDTFVLFLQLIHEDLLLLNDFTSVTSCSFISCNDWRKSVLFPATVYPIIAWISPAFKIDSFNISLFQLRRVNFLCLTLVSFFILNLLRYIKIHLILFVSENYPNNLQEIFPIILCFHSKLHW
jgi:hypothetical protein